MFYFESKNYVCASFPVVLALWPRRWVIPSPVDCDYRHHPIFPQCEPNVLRIVCRVGKELRIVCKFEAGSYVIEQRLERVLVVRIGG